MDISIENIIVGDILFNRNFMKNKVIMDSPVGINADYNKVIIDLHAIMYLAGIKFNGVSFKKKNSFSYCRYLLEYIKPHFTHIDEIIFKDSDMNTLKLKIRHINKVSNVIIDFKKNPGYPYEFDKTTTVVKYFNWESNFYDL